MTVNIPLISKVCLSAETSSKLRIIGAHYVDIVGVTGSIPVAPTIVFKNLAHHVASSVSHRAAADNSIYASRSYEGDGRGCSHRREGRGGWRPLHRIQSLSKPGQSQWCFGLLALSRGRKSNRAEQGWQHHREGVSVRCGLRRSAQYSVRVGE